MARLFTPARRPLLLPGSTKRALRRPDARGLIVPQLSGAPLWANEVDYDELEILRTWREYEANSPGEVRYFCYELRQRDPGADSDDVFFKAVRLIRLTRVPRYLKQGTGHHGPHMVFQQMRDVIVGLREKQALFLNVIAKSPQLPLVFGYGVQGHGDTLEAAKQMADEGYAALSFALDGTYQQLEYAPLKVEEGEMLARYQAEWNHIAMARGRPMPVGDSLGTSAVLDGNRTDADSTNNQLEAFIRGMGDKSFMLSLVTVPLTPADMNAAWRNIAQKLSAVRSDQQGQRSVNAGISLPLGMGAALADGSGTTHGVTGTHGLGTSDGQSASVSQSVGVSHSDGMSQSVTNSHGTSTSLGQSVGTSDSVSHGQSVQAGTSHSDGTSVSDSQSTSHGVSVGESHGLTNTQSMTNTQGVSTGQSLSDSQSASANWSDSLGKSLSGGQTLTDAWNRGFSDSLAQAWNLGNTHGDGVNGSGTLSNGSDVKAGLLGVGGGNSTSSSQTQGQSQSNSDSVGLGQTWTGGRSAGVSGSLAQSLSQGVNWGESQGGSLGHSVTAAQSVGTSQSLSQGQSLSASNAQSLSQSDSLGRTVGVGQSASDGTSLAQGQSLSTGQSLSQGSSLSQGVSDGQSVSGGANSTDGTSASQTTSSGASTALSQQQAMSDAYMVAMSRQASQTGSLGVVPSFGVSISRATFDESKRVIGDILEAQMKRYQEGLEGGGLLYQMFLVCEDRETLVGASSLLKASFWGPGGDSDRLPQPFHTVVVDDAEEAGRLLTHAAAFTSYRKREPVAELIEPWVYSSYVSAGEVAAFVHPPTAEALGIQANVDSMPVLRMPSDRGNRDVYLGRVVNGERGRVSDARFGVDLNEMTHILIQGVTGSGKTTTAMRLLEQVSRLERAVITPPTPANPVVQTTVARAGVLALDWMRNMRDLASVVEPERFQLFSVSQPELGAFRWNPLEIPHEGMDPGQWLGAQADNLAASFGLGEFGRSILAEIIDDLYKANRLVEHELFKQIVDEATGAVIRRGVFLEPVDEASLPPEAIQVNGKGERYVDVYSYSPLSRLVGLNHVAAVVAAKIEAMATPEGARLQGTAMRDRLQSLWRRIQYYSPGKPGARMVSPDPDLYTRECLGVTDIIDPDRGLVTVIETDGLDLENRRVILGSVMLAVYRYGLHVGKGCFDHGGRGPGTFVVLEECHELFGEPGEGEDRTSAAMRATLYESLFRRARATGLRLVAMTQNCGQVPSAVTSQTTTVFVHRSYDPKDRERIFSLLNWSNMVGQQLREWRWLGEMPTRGWCIVRLDAKDSYLDSAPVQIVVDPPGLPSVSDEQLRALATTRAAVRR